MTPEEQLKALEAEPEAEREAIVTRAIELGVNVPSIVLQKYGPRPDLGQRPTDGQRRQLESEADSLPVEKRSEYVTGIRSKGIDFNLPETDADVDPDGLIAAGRPIEGPGLRELDKRWSLGNNRNKEPEIRLQKVREMLAEDNAELKRQKPDADREFKAFLHPENKRVIIQDPDGQLTYLDKPGLDMGDVAETVSDNKLKLGLGLVTRGASIPARIAVDAVGSVGEEVISRIDGDDRTMGDRAVGVGIDTAASGAMEGLMATGKAVLRGAKNRLFKKYVPGADVDPTKLDDLKTLNADESLPKVHAAADELTTTPEVKDAVGQLRRDARVQVPFSESRDRTLKGALARVDKAIGGKVTERGLGSQTRAYLDRIADGIEADGKASSGKLYGELRAVNKGQPLYNRTPISEAISTLRNEVLDGNELATVHYKRYLKALDELESGVPEGEFINVETLTGIRHMLNERTKDGASRLFKDVSPDTANRAEAVLREAIDRAEDALIPGADLKVVEAAKRARANHRAWKNDLKAFNDEILAREIGRTKSPEEITNKMFKLDPSELEGMMRQVRKRDPEFATQIQRGLYTKVFEDVEMAANPLKAIGDAIKKNAKKLEAIDPTNMKVLNALQRHIRSVTTAKPHSGSPTAPLMQNANTGWFNLAWKITGGQVDKFYKRMAAEIALNPEGAKLLQNEIKVRSNPRLMKAAAGLTAEGGDAFSKWVLSRPLLAEMIENE